MNKEIERNEIVAEGVWGTCPWVIDSAGNLVIDGGTGDSLVSIDSAPWNRYKEQITAVLLSQAVGMKEGSVLNYMFYNCVNLRSVNLSEFDTYGVKSMNSMFHSCCGLATVIFGESFNTSYVTDMSKMFYGCSDLKGIDLTGFDTANVMDMNSMFEGCDNLLSLDLSGFDTSKVIGMSLMFRNCSRLEEINLSGFDTSNVTGISGLFSSCASLKSLDLSHFDTSNITNMISMFMNCKSLEHVDLSGFNTARVIDMNLMFCNCVRLKSLDLSSFDTSNVIDMGMMFSSCNDLDNINLSGFNTSNVINMQNMFMYCSHITSLDLSDFDTEKVEDMNDMFTGCDNLASITVGSKFSFTGSGSTLCRLPSSSSLKYDELKWTEAATGEEYAATDIPGDKATTYFIKGRDFRASYDANGGTGEMDESEFIYEAEATPDVLNNVFTPPENHVFKEWNTKRNGKGIAYQENSKLNLLCADVTLYAIWAATPTIYAAEFLDTIEYGQRLKLKMPEIEDNNGEIISFGIEISPDGIFEWESYDPDTIPTVAYDGYYLRYYAENFVGKTYSGRVRMFIDKAVYDMSDVYWEYDEDLIYNGKIKTLILANLPEGVTAEYEGNQATEVGEYIASAKLYYDTDNYQMPPDPDECEWEIEKGSYDMSNVSWSYSEPFVYDSGVKSVYLTELPEGVTAVYDNNQGVDAGMYKAVASFDIDDQHNYNIPEEMSCTWEICKAHHDMSDVQWTYYEPLTYSGEPKTIILTGLPEGVTVSYHNNKAIAAGEYEAMAEFDVEDADNYEIPDMISCIWQVKKACYDMSNVEWHYEEAFTYDGEMKAIVLTGLPEGIEAAYSGNCEINAGSHTATAVLKYDADNYEKPEVDDCVWEIRQADYDMSNVRWTYEYPVIYDGEAKTVLLEGLPTGVSAFYGGNSRIDAGVYEANAVLSVKDAENYNTPSIEGCSWEIAKASYDMTCAHWDYNDDIVYNGNDKTVLLTGLPDGVTASYSGNTALGAGTYMASAELSVEDSDNYEIPEIAGLNWQIHKAAYDMSEVYWDYSGDFVYDGEVKAISLSGLPDGVRAEYTGNSENSAGEYEAAAQLSVDDPDNYEVPIIENCLWKIEQATYDMTGAEWDSGQEFVYDGTVKSIKLTGLPEGITARYIDNMAIYVGTYIASVMLDYDDKNYKMPTVENCHWNIIKAVYDVSDVSWDYDESFVYDGCEKRISLIGLPDGVTASYSGNSAVDVGIYTAEAALNIEDSSNYEQPVIEGCTWVITKAAYDMSRTFWAYDEDIVYDGEAKTVLLSELPDGVTASYIGNTAVDAGEYVAEAVFDVNDPYNYEIPVINKLIWEIRKAEYDMSSVAWGYNDELVYDGQPKSVVLEGLPEGVTAEYRGNIEVYAGVYNASADFEVTDNENYNVPVINQCQWEIEKRNYDMSCVAWNYYGDVFYDGTEKSVMLTGLPEGVNAEYSGCSEVKAGQYKAAAVLSIDDEENYNLPEVAPCQWEIKKGNYDMSNVRWEYHDGMFAYDGSTKTIELTGLPDGITASYSGNTGVYAGMYTASAVLNVDDSENYEIPIVDGCIWQINKGEYDVSDIVWDYNDPFTYDGKEKTVLLMNIPEKITVSYSENRMTEAGVYTASAVLNVDTDNYQTPVIDDCRWVINKAVPDISTASWDYEEAFIYDGTEKSVRLIGLPEGVTARYGDGNMTEAGVYTAGAVLSVEDTHNYNAPAIKGCQWEIRRTVYDMSDVVWEYDGAFTYDGEIKGVYLTGLPEGVTANYSGNRFINAGIYTANATFDYDERNYEAPVIDGCRWEIMKAEYDMSTASWYQNEEFIYDGTEKSISLIDLPEGVIASYSGNCGSTAGSYTAGAVFSYDENNYEAPVIDDHIWEIKKANIDMSNVRWDYSGAFKYDGTEKTVAIEEPQKPTNSFKKLFKLAKDAPLTGLPEGVTASCIGNSGVDAGIYTASAILSVADPQNYEIPKLDDCIWEIKKAEHDMSNVAWDYNKAFVYDGEEKSIFLTGLPAGVFARYTGNKGTVAGIYEAAAELSIDDPDNYEIPMPLATCEWQIDKGHYDMRNARWSYSQAFVYDGQEKSIGITGLPAEVTVSYSGNTAINVGTYIAEAELSIEDMDNYEIPVIGNCKWQISKASHDMSRVVWDYNETFTYDEMPKSIYLKNLPAGLVANYSENSKIDAGTYIASVEFDYDSDNYEKPFAESCKWKIEKAVYDMSYARWNYEDAFVYDGKEKNIEMIGLPEGITARYSENRAINADKYTAQIVFEYDKVNYFEPNIVRNCQWEIKKATPELIIDNTSYVKAYVDDAFALGVVTNADIIKYEVSNEEIVAVTDAGMVSIKGVGKTTILVTVEGDNYKPVTGSISIEVIDAV